MKPGSMFALLLLFAPLAARGQSAAPVVVQPGAPGEPTKTLPPGTRPTAPQASPADISFMQGMILHHSQAVEMTALIPTHTTNAQVRLLGERISASQSDEMNFMKRWLHSRGLPTTMPTEMADMPGMTMASESGPDTAPMPGMLTPRQMAALRAAHGAAFDHLFLTGMIQHHGGALTMVDDLFHAAGSGQDADLFDFATDADNTQRAEIRIMQSMLAKEARSASPHPVS